MRKNKDGYYVIDNLEKLREWHKITDLKRSEKHKERAYYNKELEKIKKESIKRQKKQNGLEL
jgi:uncharacterized protein with FMN-binding domain